MLETARSRPARAGPAKKPTLSIVEDATFDAASSPGSSARSGITEAWAERKGEPQSDVTTARARIASDGAPEAMSAAPQNTSTARDASEETITSRREYRSPRVAAKGVTIANETYRITPSTPTAVGPPRS